MDEAINATSAVRRANRARYSQVAPPELFNFGSVHICNLSRALWECGFVADAVLPENGREGLENCRQHFAALGAQCRRWIPAAGQDLQAWQQALERDSFDRLDLRAFVHGPASTPAPAASNIRVISARAMPRAFAALANEATNEAEPHAAEARQRLLLERLNDPQYSPFVALRGDRACGIGALFVVGEIGLLCDVFSSPTDRGVGIGTALVKHMVETARRWSLRCLCSQAHATNVAAADWLKKTGFVPGGTIPSFVSPGVATMND